ncbi:MAG: ArnT family glycosyltransferase, partial [bacterium]
RAGRLPLALIALGYVALAIVYNVYTPPYEGPDEPQHFAYVLWLVQEGRFPPQGDAAWDTPVEQEASQPPLYYLLASIPARLVDLDDPAPTFRPNPNFVGPFPRDFFDNDNRAIHYSRPPLRGGWLAFYMARGVSTAFGLLLVASAFGLARQVWPQRPRRVWLVTLFVAAIPQVIYLGSVVSNDVPVAALGTLTLWQLAVLLRGDRRPHRALLLGLAFGLAVLAKVSALTLSIPLAAGLLWLWRAERRPLREVVHIGLWIAVAAFVVAGWWFVRSWLLYGSPLGLETHDATAWAIADVEELDRGWRRWWEVFRSFWIWLGWGTVRPDFRAYYVLFLLALLAVPGLVLDVARRWRAGTWRRDGVLLAVLLVAVLAVALFLEVWMRRVVAPYGRLLYPALGAIAVLLVHGWTVLHRRLALAPIGFLLALALVAPPAIIAPAYAPPQTLSPQEIAALEPSLDLHFGPSPEETFARLVRVQPLQRSVDAGTLAPIEICWETLGAADRDYSVLVQIVGPHNQLVGSRRTYPGLGTYPTSRWSAGDVFCDVVNVLTRESLERTLVYNVEVAMLDHESEERLPIYDGDGALWEVAFLDRIRVESANDEGRTPSLPAPSPALQLTGYDLEARQWQPGDEYSLTLRWVAASPPESDYQVFVHLRDPRSGEPVAQADGPPLDGWYPTSWWPVEQQIVDERVFPLPQEVAPGSYELVVGFYDLHSGQRVGQEHTLGAVEVLP